MIPHRAIYKTWFNATSGDADYEDVKATTKRRILRSRCAMVLDSLTFVAAVVFQFRLVA